MTVMRRPPSPLSAAIRHGLAAACAVLTGVGVLLGLPAPAEADWVRQAQWQLTALHASDAWRVSSGTGVTVAVLDSGVDASHPDLAGQVLPGADFVDGSTDGRSDPVGHGTTVAAEIAGRADHSSGVVGIAPGAKILPVRVLDADNRYDDATTVAKGLRWAVTQHVQVVNMSLGGSVRSAVLASAISYALAHGVVVVACTGNVEDGASTQMWYPASQAGVIAVAGLAETPSHDPNQLTAWHGGLIGPQTALSAPASDLLGARPGGYWRVDGTSFAAALVTGAAALVRSRWPGMDVANVVNRLVRTAQPLTAKGRDARYGYGEVDPLAALTAEVPPVTANPLTPAGSGQSGATALAAGTGPVTGGLELGTIELGSIGEQPGWWAGPIGLAIMLVLIRLRLPLHRRRFRSRYRRKLARTPTAIGRATPVLVPHPRPVPAPERPAATASR
jgi:type VII secretion-associated serine protease mycosin